MNLEDFLSKASSASCITSKGKAAALVLEAVRAYSPDAYTDTLGSIIAPISPPAPGGIHLMLDAHLDEIGFIVTSIDENGFLLVSNVGGADLRVLLGQEVIVFGKQPLFGVFCCLPPHLMDAAEKGRGPKPDELAVDIGYGREKAEQLVSPGDLLTLRQKLAPLKEGLITGKALDNRAGVATILRALDLLQESKPNFGLTAVFSISEELGERGAAAAAFSVAPTHALIFDVSYGYTPDAPRGKCGELHKGPMLGVSPALSREVTDRLFSLARKLGIAHQPEIMGGRTGTNSDAISISRSGVLTGMLSIPLRYMHTPVEAVALEDIESTAQLTAAYIRALGGEADV